jgi:hypothetical protein
MSPTINSFVDNLVRLKTHQEDIDMRGRALDETKRQHNVDSFGTENPAADPVTGVMPKTLAERQAITAEQKAAQNTAKLPDHQQILNPAEVVQKKITFRTAYGEGAVKAFAPLFDTVDEVAAANPNTTKWDAYTSAKGSWAGQRDDIIANSEKYMMSPEYEKLKPSQKEAFAKLFNTIKYDTTGDTIYDQGVFKNTVASKKQEDENSKAALLAARGDVKADPFTVFLGEQLRNGVPATDAITKWKELENTGKSQTEEQLTGRALKGDKQAQGILDAMQKRKLDIAAKNRAIIGNPAGAQSFPQWEQPDKEMAYQTKMLTGKGPVFASRDAESRAGFEQGYNAFIREKGFKASDISLMQSDYRAGNMSLGNMSKQEAPMNAFVLNINKQVNKLEELYKTADRTGLRIFDLPWREIKVRAKGSGREAVLASYLLEVSNEIGKLSSGASASVQQLSDSAKEDWKKVHDVNLSPKEIMYVLKATKDQANMRMTTWREAKEQVRSGLRGLGIDQVADTEAPLQTATPALTPARRAGDTRRPLSAY